MKRVLILVLAVSCPALAQETANFVFAAPIQAEAMRFSTFGGPGAVIKGAPYSATITNESVQTLADGTRIVQSSDGSAARDSQGRTRQDAPLPMIGGLAAADAPHLVMIQDPAAGMGYTLNLTDKTAWTHPLAPGGPHVVTMTATATAVRSGTGALPASPTSSETLIEQKRIAEGQAVVSSGTAALASDSQPSPGMFMHKRLMEAEGDGTTEDIGTQTMEGVQVTGVRTTRIIPAGKIGNDRPINIVTEVWTSPELKTIVLSKRNDPRTGEQTFKLTNIQRSEPDPSLFTVPSDFKTNSNGAQTIIYRTKH